MLIMFIPVWYVAPTSLPSLAWENFPLWPGIHICECQMGVLSKNWPRILHVIDRSETGSHTQSRWELLQLMMHFALIVIVNCIKRILYLYWQLWEWTIWGVLLLPWCVSVWGIDTRFSYPDSKIHGTNMGPISGRQDPGGPHVGPMNFAIWVITFVLMTARCGWCKRIPP